MFTKAKQSLMLLMGDHANKDLGFQEEKKELCRYFPVFWPGLWNPEQVLPQNPQSVACPAATQVSDPRAPWVGCSVCAAIGHMTPIVQAWEWMSHSLAGELLERA